MNVQEQLKEFGYSQNIKTKNEQIEKLNSIINNLKDQINKEHIEKSKQKELNNIQKELGVIEIFDLKNILPENKFLETKLKIRKKEVQVHIKGINKQKYKGNNSIDNVNKSNKEHKKIYSIYGANNKNDNKNKKSNNINKEISLSLQKGRKK